MNCFLLISNSQFEDTNISGETVFKLNTLLLFVKNQITKRLFYYKYESYCVKNLFKF